MNILAIDPGSRNMGLALLHSRDGLKRSKQVAVSCYADIAIAIETFAFRKNHNTTVIIERQFRNNKCIGAQAVCEATVERMNVQAIYVIPPSTWQSTVLKGLRVKGDKPSVAYMQLAEKLYGLKFDHEFGEDESAAICMAHYLNLMRED